MGSCGRIASKLLLKSNFRKWSNVVKSNWCLGCWIRLYPLPLQFLLPEIPFKYAVC